MKAKDLSGSLKTEYGILEGMCADLIEGIMLMRIVTS